MNDQELLDYTKRMMMVIAAEIAETRSRVGRLSEQLETLAAAHGVPVMWGESLEGEAD